MNNFEYLDGNDISNIIHDIISEYKEGSDYKFYDYVVGFLKNGINLDDDTVYDILVFLTSFSPWRGSDYYDSFQDKANVFDTLYINNIKISFNALERFVNFIYGDPLNHLLIGVCLYKPARDRFIYLKENYFKIKIDMIIASGTKKEKLEVLKTENLPSDIVKRLFDSIIKDYSDKEKLIFLSKILKNYPIDATYLINLYVKEGIIDKLSIKKNKFNYEEYTKKVIDYLDKTLFVQNEANKDKRNGRKRKIKK